MTGGGPPSASKPEDMQKLLDAAETHFGRQGYVAASVRRIVLDAGMTLEDVRTHFTRKQDLLFAAVDRFAEPVVQQQFVELSALGPRCHVEDLLRAFYGPPLRRIHGLGRAGERLALFLARCQTEGPPVAGYLEARFSRVRDYFMEALRRSLPELSEADVQWRFELCLGLLLTFLTRQGAVRDRLGASGRWCVDEAVEDLVGFATRGLKRS